MNTSYLNQIVSNFTTQLLLMINDSVIEFKDATIYQGDVPVITNLNLALNKGEFVYLL